MSLVTVDLLGGMQSVICMQVLAVDLTVFSYFKNSSEKRNISTYIVSRQYYPIVKTTKPCYKREVPLLNNNKLNTEKGLYPITKSVYSRDVCTLRNL